MRGPHRALAILLLGLAAAHVAFARAQPAPAAFGDEQHYAKVVARDLRDGTRSLLPGGLRPAMRTELGARVLSLFAEPGFEPEDLLPPAARLNLVLFLLVVGATFLQGRALGLSPAASVAAAAALGLFPWFAFHVHTLWPEMLHAAFASVALLALFAFARRPRVDLLVVAGVALGYAQLTKSSLGPFSLVAVPGVAAAAWAHGADLPRVRRAGRALLAALVLAATLGAVLVPQMRANARAGFGFGLGANRWWNLELAVRTPRAVPGDDADGTRVWELQRGITRDYMAASRLPRHRERLARERALAHVRERGPGRTAAAQLAKFADVLIAPPGLPFYRQPALEQAVGHRRRWGEPTPGWIRALAAPARPMWWGILAAGLVGLALAARRDRAWLFPAAFVACGLAVVLAVPIKFRFVLPVAPVLCLGVGALVEHLLRRRGGASKERPSVLFESP